MVNDKGLEAAARKLCELNTTEDDYYWHRTPPMTKAEYIEFHWQDWVDDAREAINAYISEDHKNYYRMFEMEHEADEYASAMLVLDTMKAPRDVDGQMLSIAERIRTFLGKQEPLGDNFSKILHDNLWDLYDENDKDV